MCDVIYKCTISQATTTKQRAYLGLAEGEWKQRYYNHTQSFRNARRKNDRALSSDLWELKKKTSEIPKLTWPLLKTVAGYSYISKRCLSCLHEKPYVATYHDQEESLNKWSELKELRNYNNQHFKNVVFHNTFTLNHIKPNICK